MGGTVVNVVTVVTVVTVLTVITVVTWVVFGFFLCHDPIGWAHGPHLSTRIVSDNASKLSRRSSQAVPCCVRVNASAATDTGSFGEVCLVSKGPSAFAL